jgi:hypothetical protein
MEDDTAISPTAITGPGVEPVRQAEDIVSDIRAAKVDVINGHLRIARGMAALKADHDWPLRRIAQETECHHQTVKNHLDWLALGDERPDYGERIKALKALKREDEVTRAASEMGQAESDFASACQAASDNGRTQQEIADAAGCDVSEVETRVQQIIRLESEADKLEAEADEKGRVAARLVLTEDEIRDILGGAAPSCGGAPGFWAAYPLRHMARTGQKLTVDEYREIANLLGDVGPELEKLLAGTCQGCGTVLDHLRRRETTCAACKPEAA